MLYGKGTVNPNLSDSDLQFTAYFWNLINYITTGFYFLILKYDDFFVFFTFCIAFHIEEIGCNVYTKHTLFH